MTSKTSKKCSKCGVTKPDSDFHKSSRNTSGLASACKSCVQSSAKERYHRDPVATALTARQRHLRINFGITLEEYDSILKSQGDACAICRKPCVTGRKLAVDHDHETGEVRGLLCMNCNKHKVGNLKLEEVNKIKNYLENPPARQMFGGIPRYVPEGKEKPKRRRKRRTVKYRRS